MAEGTESLQETRNHLAVVEAELRKENLQNRAEMEEIQRMLLTKLNELERQERAAQLAAAESRRVAVNQFKQAAAQKSLNAVSSAASATNRLARSGAKFGLRKASQATNAIGEHVRNKGLATLYFIISAIAVYMVEFGLNGSWSARLVIYAVLLFLNFLFFRDTALLKRAAIVVLIVFAGLSIFALGTVTSFVSKYTSASTVLLLVSLVVMPLYLWWMLFDSEDFAITRFVRTGGLILMGAIILVTVGPSLSNAAQVLPTPAGGFNAGQAAHDSLVHVATSASSGISSFVCLLGIGKACNFATTWLGRITEPFAYDATTVDKIQNDKLGVYIQNAAVDGTIDVSGYGMGDYLPKGISFQLSAPIPPSVEFEICSAKGSTLKGFAGLCDRNVTIGCAVQNVASTSIQPSDKLTIRDAISSQGALFSCRLQPPSDPSLLRGSYTSTSKTARITISYPFVTNTYKLIRAVDESQAYSTAAVKQLNSFSAPQIVSSGGPVIVQTSESKFIPIKDSGTTTTPLLITLKAKPDVRLTKVEQMGIYVPSGSELVNQPGTYCQFVTGSAVEQENKLLCQDAQGKTGTITTNSAQCKTAHDTCYGTIAQGSTAQTNACDYYSTNCNIDFSETSPGTSSACTPLSKVFGSQSGQPGTFYYLTATAIRKINQDLGSGSISTSGVNDFQGGNSIELNCNLRIDDKNKFLSPDQLVTERAVNILSEYDVQESSTVTVPFQGSLGSTSSSTFDFGGVCQLPSGQLPKGVIPLQLTGSNKVIVGDVFGAPRAGNVPHAGVDLQSTSGGTVVPAWDGTVSKICTKGSASDSGCDANYGNYVVVQTTYQGGTFKTLYGLLDQDPSKLNPQVTMGEDVTAGQTVLGHVGSSSGSSGSHLHFEVLVNDKPIDPFALIDDPSAYDTENGKYKAAHANAVSDQCTSPLGPSSLQNVARYAYTPQKLQDIKSAIDNAPTAQGEAKRSCDALTASQYEAIVVGAEKWNIDPAFMIALAAQEHHCAPYPQANPMGAVGMFQIRAAPANPSDITYCSDEWNTYKQAHPGVDYKTALITDFGFQADCAAEIAYNKWKTAYNAYVSNNQVCGQYCSCTDSTTGQPFTQTDYAGYKATAKAYNGWGCKDTAIASGGYAQNVGNMYKAIVNAIYGSSVNAETAYNTFTVGGTTTA